MMIPIDFGVDRVYINEWAGLNVKSLKQAYFMNGLCFLFHIWIGNVVREGLHDHAMKMQNFIDMRGGRGLL